MGKHVIDIADLNPTQLAYLKLHNSLSSGWQIGTMINYFKTHEDEGIARQLDQTANYISLVKEMMDDDAT